MKFDGVIGGPPCQAFSPLRRLVEYNGYQVAEDLIPEFARVVCEAAPTWWLMENVPDAPRPFPEHGQRLVIRDDWVGGDTRRLRVFWWGGPAPLEVDWPALHRPDPAPPVLAAGFDAGSARGRERKKKAAALGYKSLSTLEASLRLQGLPPAFLADAPFTVAGKIKAVGNGVPMAMGRAVARAVKQALRS
jgi:DNA (cytosine-5)-methyltransferase 1